MEVWEEIEHRIKNIASLIKMRDNGTYTGKNSELSCEIAMKIYALADLMQKGEEGNEND